MIDPHQHTEQPAAASGAKKIVGPACLTIAVLALGWVGVGMVRCSETAARMEKTQPEKVVPITQWGVVEEGNRIALVECTPLGRMILNDAPDKTAEEMQVTARQLREGNAMLVHKTGNMLFFDAYRCPDYIYVNLKKGR